MNFSVSDKNRAGDHIWYISDVRKFQKHFPHWQYVHNLEETLVEIHDHLVQR